MKSWNRNVLLQIKRQFTKEEAVALLLAELSKAKVENGKLMSEIMELKYRIAKEANKKKQDMTEEEKEERSIKKMQSKMSKQGAEIKKLREDRDRLLSLLHNKN